MLAAPTPINCFEIDTMQTLLSYDEANPACPSDVELPSSVRYVGQFAFYGTGITSVTFTDDQYGIHSGAFAFTSQLTRVDFANNIDSIDYDAFYGSALQSVTIPDSVKFIGDQAFMSNNLTSVTLGSGVTHFGNYIFSGNYLTDITLPSTMTTVPKGMFLSNHFTSLTIPNTVTAIGDDAFSSNQLTTLAIPNTVTSIGAGAFSDNQLTSLALPDSVTTIGTSAFMRNKMAQLSLGERVASIGPKAFSYNSLASVYIPDSVVSIQPSAFAFQSPLNKALVFLVPANQMQALYDKIWYVQLFTQDGTNPHNLTDSLLREQTELGSDADGDGTNDSVGGYIIDPATVVLNYVDAGSAALTSAETYTGTNLHTYNITENTDSNLARYYRQGTNLSVSAPIVAGYVQPATATLLLTSGANQHTFSYAAPTPTADPPTVIIPLVGGGLQTPLSGQKSGSEQVEKTPQGIIVANEPTINNPTATETEQTEEQSNISKEKVQEGSSVSPRNASTDEKRTMNIWILVFILVGIALVATVLIRRYLRSRP